MRLSLILLAATLPLTVLPSSGLAHAVFNQTSAEAGSLVTAQARITHGCDGQATHTVTITMPQGVTRVTPRVIPGWTVSVTKRPLATPLRLHGQTITETVDTITWTGGSVPDFAFEQFEFRFAAPAEPGRTLYFPLVQTCANGTEAWDQIPARIEDWGRTADPAPYITLSAPPAARRGGHSH